MAGVLGGANQRVDLGTAVIVAPWWNPVRLASEINMLDILLRGRRLHLGIGRGIAPHEYASLGIPIEQSHTYYYDVVNAFRPPTGRSASPSTAQVYKIPPTTIRPQGRHKGDLTTRIKAAFTTKKSAQLAAETGLGQMFVAGDDLESMTAQVKQFNQIRRGLGLPPDQPTTLLWMYCAETEPRGRGGLGVLPQPAPRRPAPLLRVEQPGLQRACTATRSTSKRQTADVGVVEASLAARRATQPIGTPEEIIEKIKTIQQAISLETLVIHFFYGGMPPDKAEKSLRLFAERCCPP